MTKKNGVLTFIENNIKIISRKKSKFEKNLKLL